MFATPLNLDVNPLLHRPEPTQIASPWPRNAALLVDKRPVGGLDEAANHGRKITPPAVADPYAHTDWAHLVAASSAVKELLYLRGEDRVDFGYLMHIDGSIDRSAPEFIVAKLPQRLEYALGYALQVFLVHFCDPIRATA